MSTLPNHTLLVKQDADQIHGLHHPSRHSDPLIVEHAEGVWLYGDDGRKVLDGMAGLWNVNIGYGNDRAAARLRDRCWPWPTPPASWACPTRPPSELAEKLAGYAHPTLNTTYFTSGGSESNETAFKTVRYYWRRLGQPEQDQDHLALQRLPWHHPGRGQRHRRPRYWKMFGLPLDGYVHVAAPNSYRYDGDLREGETVGQAAARAIEGKDPGRRRRDSRRGHRRADPGRGRPHRAAGRLFLAGACHLRPV